MTNQAANIAKTLISHLRTTNQLSLLGEVVELIKRSSEYQNSQNIVTVTSAFTLSSDDLKGIKSYLDKSIGDSYELIQAVDPALLAGFTLQVNDTFIDASVLGKINTVQNKLTTKE